MPKRHEESNRQKLARVTAEVNSNAYLAGDAALPPQQIDATVGRVGWFGKETVWVILAPRFSLLLMRVGKTATLANRQMRLR